MTQAPIDSPFLTREKLISTLSELVRINSVNPGFDGPAGGEAKVAEWAARFMREAGLDAHIADSPEGRPNVRVRIEGRSSGPALMLQTHIDTVSVSGMKIEPFEPRIEGGRLWGRGSTDAKGQVASLMHAVIAWHQSGQKPPRPIELALCADEESGFLGAKALARTKLDVAAIVIAEPTSLRVVTTHKGLIRWNIDFEGKAAHAARPHLGVNAITAAAVLVDEIDRNYVPMIRDRRAPLLEPPTINVAMIQGGVQYNLVPPACRVFLERRMIPGETPEAVLREFEDLFAACEKKWPGFKARQQEPNMVAPAMQTDANHPLARMAGKVAAQFGVPPNPIGVDYGTDACVLGALGLPIVIVGPGSIDQAHTSDEFIEIEQLVAGASYFARLIGEEW
ncbi:M20 family metallopeptidase [bacterium]|nr:M20 family metallopeptidase [bacterium]